MKIFHYDDAGYYIGESEYDGKVAPEGATNLWPPASTATSALRFSVRHNRWYVVGESSGQLDAVKEARRAEVTAKRWAVETGGIRTPQGAVVLTGTADQNRIATSVSGMEQAGIDSIDFKSASGWIKLTLDELKGVMTLISRHVEACFSREKSLHDEIDRCLTVEDVAGVDIDAGWPANADVQVPQDDDWEAEFDPVEPEETP